MKGIILSIIIAFTFNACATKDNSKIQTPNPSATTKTTTVEKVASYEDDFGSEFDNEFSQETQKEVFDPLSGYNRAMTTFNDFLFMNVMNPIAKGYAYVLPQTVRVGVSNFFDNLLFPIRFTNNLLQLKFENAGVELGRFVVNSLWGLGGFMDPATNELGWKQYDEDFGQTLGYYGVGSGFHIVLPILGPSNLRDMFSMVPDGYISPISTTGSSDIPYKIPNNNLEAMGIMGLKTTNSISLKLGQYENIKKDALDLYPFLRDIYEQRRNQQIKE